MKGLVRVADGNVVSGEGYLAAVHREQAVCRLTDLTDAGGAQTTEPKNLTLVQVKGYVLEMVGADIPQRQGHLVFELGSGVAPVIVAFDFPAHHTDLQILQGDVLAAFGGKQFAVS